MPRPSRGSATLLGVATLPPIVTSRLAREPVAIGLRRPRVVLPEGLTEAVPGDALRDILVHECAHILRGDIRVGLLQRLLGVVYWPHPLVHYLNARRDAGLGLRLPPVRRNRPRRLHRPLTGPRDHAVRAVHPVSRSTDPARLAS